MGQVQRLLKPSSAAPPPTAGIHSLGVAGAPELVCLFLTSYYDPLQKRPNVERNVYEPHVPVAQRQRPSSVLTFAPVSLASCGPVGPSATGQEGGRGWGEEWQRKGLRARLWEQKDPGWRHPLLCVTRAATVTSLDLGFLLGKIAVVSTPPPAPPRPLPSWTRRRCAPKASARAGERSLGERLLCFQCWTDVRGQGAPGGATGPAGGPPARCGLQPA